MRPPSVSAPLIVRSEEDELLAKIARCDTAMAELLDKRQRCERRLRALEERLALEEESERAAADSQQLGVEQQQQPPLAEGNAQQATNST